MGKNLKKNGYMSIITKSLCCTPETNKTLQSNYTPIYIFFKKSRNSANSKTFIFISNTPYNWAGQTGEPWLLSGDT